MPIILKNSHSHAFSYVDKHGENREVKVMRNQDIEPLEIPARRLAQLVGETVVSMNGKQRLPRYQYMENAEDAGGTYTAGVVSSRRREDQLSAQKHAGDTLTEDQNALLRAAEQAEAAANQDALREETELAQAAQEQAERDAKDQERRAAKAEKELEKLKAQLAAAENKPKAGRPPKASTPDK